jgi:hypothetical protein
VAGDDFVESHLSSNEPAAEPGVPLSGELSGVTMARAWLDACTLMGAGNGGVDRERVKGAADDESFDFFFLMTSPVSGSVMANA